MTSVHHRSVPPPPASPEYIVFSDESGTHSGPPCFTIGAFVVPVADYDRHTQALEHILLTHGLDDEMKWAKIRDHRKRNAAALAGIDCLLSAGARFSAIVVDKASFTKWQADEEGGFYHAYYELMRFIVREVGGRVLLRMDERSDRYAKQHDVMGIIVNHTMARDRIPSSLVDVEKSDSHDFVLLQFADVLTGAINSDTARVRHGYPMNADKVEFARALAQRLGWESLHHDTYPNSVFNIWHFPLGTRGPSREVMAYSSLPPQAPGYSAATAGNAPARPPSFSSMPDVVDFSQPVENDAESEGANMVTGNEPPLDRDMDESNVNPQAGGVQMNLSRDSEDTLLVAADTAKKWRERALNLVEELAGEHAGSSDLEERAAGELALAAVRGLRPYTDGDVPPDRREAWAKVFEAAVDFIPKGREGLGLVRAVSDLARAYKIPVPPQF